MAKGGRPDKENMITGMFQKIAREADRIKKKEIREAKRRGEFIKIDSPELLSIPEQEKYYAALRKWEKGGDQYKTTYERTSSSFPWPYKFRKDLDK
jgi:hypothetical protein|tara:strand:- start:270 stop:557 length:288 start_codon:yes stop_codon:yes gene_type:complete